MLRKLLGYLYYFRSLRKIRHGCGLRLGRGGIFIRPEHLQIGNDVFINRNFHISAQPGMKFGSHILIGPDFLAECDDHRIDIPGQWMSATAAERVIAPITIGDDVWIGARVCLLKGVRIGEGCVVGAGSVVTRSLPPYTICAGVPCRVIRGRFTEEELKKHLGMIKSGFSLEAVLEEWQKHHVNI